MAPSDDAAYIRQLAARRLLRDLQAALDDLALELHRRASRSSLPDGFGAAEAGAFVDLIVALGRSVAGVAPMPAPLGLHTASSARDESAASELEALRGQLASVVSERDGLKAELARLSTRVRLEVFVESAQAETAMLRAVVRELTIEVGWYESLLGPMILSLSRQETLVASLIRSAHPPPLPSDTVVQPLALPTMPLLRPDFQYSIANESGHAQGSTDTTASTGGCVPSAFERKRQASPPASPHRSKHRPPEPISFDPADRRFKALYLSTLSLYRQHARALWDRTHFFLPADGPGRSELLAQCRRRNSSMSAAFKQHYRYLMDFVRTNSFVEADIFMDPFFFWPPPVGVLLAFGRDGGSVGDCVDRLDRAEPFRVYYAHSRSRSRHPVSVCYERVFGKFVQTRPPSAVGPPSDDSGLRTPSAPPASPPGSPTTAVLDALRDRREGPESPRANPRTNPVS
ncbi:hypothetical protein ATCC90586_009247 [Pythium insidiosum]|nr:hypothetical protein ATCC90586_009247 [Pythium insidiosum]